MELGRQIARALERGDLRSRRRGRAGQRRGESAAYPALHPRARSSAARGGRRRHRGRRGAQPLPAAEPRSRARRGFSGAVVAADGALGACLRSGVVPHLVVSVDPHPERIVRWFGDPALTAAGADDYFRRQEMDPTHREDEVAANRALVGAGGRHAPGIKVAVATSAAPAVVDRCEQAGMELYWWNPMYDDYELPGQRLPAAPPGDNGLPCLNGGGNVGTAAWVADPRDARQAADRTDRHGLLLPARHALQEDPVLPGAGGDAR